MRRLKETRRQIEERTTRDIKRRTEARLAQLRQEVTEIEEDIEQESVVLESDEEHSEDDSPPTCAVCLQRQVYWRACVRLSCFLLFLFLLPCLNRIYHAPEKRYSTI
jgi:hypothetical protein